MQILLKELRVASVTPIRGSGGHFCSDCSLLLSLCLVLLGLLGGLLLLLHQSLHLLYLFDQESTNDSITYEIKELLLVSDFRMS